MKKFKNTESAHLCTARATSAQCPPLSVYLHIWAAELGTWGIF